MTVRPGECMSLSKHPDESFLTSNLGALPYHFQRKNKRDCERQTVRFTDCMLRSACPEVRRHNNEPYSRCVDRCASPEAREGGNVPMTLPGTSGWPHVDRKRHSAGHHHRRARGCAALESSFDDHRVPEGQTRSRVQPWATRASRRTSRERVWCPRGRDLAWWWCCVVSRFSRTQHCVTLNTTESEYVALTEVTTVLPFLASRSLKLLA